MTRLSLFVALGALAFAGCKGGSASGGTASLDGIGEASTMDQLGYDAAYNLGDQQDSTFSFDRFRDGFNAGLAGDSAEVAYALGLQVGLSLKADTTIRLNPDIFLAAFREGLEGAERRLSVGQVGRARAVFQDSMQYAQLRQVAATDSSARAIVTQADRGRAQADSFLTAVSRRRGVQRTASGIYYQINRQGSGASPQEDSRVRVDYVGQLPNGTEFDRSAEGQPAELMLNQVVPGFAEMVMAMKPGETRTFWLAPELAYGLRGQPGADGTGGIPPSSALQFRVTLREVLPPAPAMQFPPGMMPGM